MELTGVRENDGGRCERGQGCSMAQALRPQGPRKA